MKSHFEIVFALLSYFGVCLLILGWIWLCLSMARKAAGENSSPDQNKGGRPPRPRRPGPSSEDRGALPARRRIAPSTDEPRQTH